MSSLNFLDLHTTLIESATAFPPKIQYVLRHVPPPKVVPSKGEAPAPVKRQYLTGYGVGLDLKKMDYLALDDRRSSSASMRLTETPDLIRLAGSASSDVKDVAAEDDTPFVDIVREALSAIPSLSSEPLNLTAPLTKEEFQCEFVPITPLRPHMDLDLGVQATSLILQSQNPLDTLVQLAENFPLYATELARKIEINGELQFEMALNSRRVPKGTSLLWLNGKTIDDMTSFNPFKYVNTVSARVC